MQDFPYVLSEYEEINSLLYKPINSTQRIKYTCFHISLNYIVLGSTSGSIYLFTREPCSFLQLIPLSEGAVLRVVISPDEKTIALATTRGSVCLVSLKPTPKIIAVSTEHIHEQISSLCWNDNSSEIYVGDSAGKVSVMVLSIFTVNSIFQTPACVLMNLDSAIVQLSFSSPLLVASTLSRCYVCDTVQEQYKQIGNKARNGEFGACFYKTYEENKNTSTMQRDDKTINRKRSFSFVPESDSNVLEENFPKIFCARPGSRLWEVSANGVVLNTHQFKEALAVPPVTVCKTNVRKIVKEERKEHIWSAQSINFSHLFVISQKYLFSYTSNGLYILDPLSAGVILWCNEFTNILSVETIENRIYLMTNDAEFHCLTFSLLDPLILRLYSKKRYYDCLEVCLLYKSELQNLISDREINDICDIESKLEILREDELSTMLHPIITILQSKLDTSPIKLDSGIVVVNPGNMDLKSEEHCRYKSMPKTPSSSSNASNASSSESEAAKEMEKLSIESNECTMITNKNVSDTKPNSNEPMIEDTKNENVLSSPTNKSNQNITERVQSDLEAIYSLVSNIKISMSETELEDTISDIEWRMNTIKDSYENLIELKSFVYEVMRTAELHYFNTLLENTSLQIIRSTTSSSIVRQLIRAFVNVDGQNCSRCNCGCPHPADQLTEPKFLEVGRSLLRKLKRNNEECVNMCNEVPYMWREYLPIYVEQKGILNDLLHECLQSRDNIVLSIIVPLLDTNQWTLLITYLTEMTEGRCLSCSKSTKKVNYDPLIDWTGVTREIMKKQGPDIAMTVLTKLEEMMPNISIDRSIFQSLIFTKILYQHGMKYAIDFNKNNLEASEYNTVCSAKVRDQLIEVLEKDLRRPISKSVFGSGAHHWGMHYQNKSSTCPCCTLSLQTPVLLGNNGIAIFSCGHAYHVNCMIERKITTCNLH